jgi:hypothetical protein
MRKIVLSIGLVVLFLTSMQLNAANLEGMKQLIPLGFRVIETADLFMIKSNSSVNPILRIEKIPCKFNLPEGRAQDLLKELSEARMVSRLTDSLNKLEEAIITRQQNRYLCKLDANCDGHPDLYIGPAVEYLSANSFRYPCVVKKEHQKKIRSSVKNFYKLKNSPLLPTFKSWKIGIRAESHSPTSSFSLADYENVKPAPFGKIESILLETKADGNLKISLYFKDIAEAISFNTSFAWKKA